ncbi:MAG: sigma-54-dependent transcriptional regulator [Nannocystales bacterium]
MPRIHVVDDDTEIRLLLGAWLASAGYAVDGFGCGQAYLDHGGPHPALVCLDLNMPDPDGLAVLRTLRARGVPCRIVVFTADDAVNTAVECMKLGAFDFVVKPIHKEGFLRVVEAALRPELAVAQAPDRTRAELPLFLGESAVMEAVRTEIGKVADTDITVFIHGESGTGKELVARSIHASSNRADGPFIALNCGAIPEALQESVLFGHEKGAFTGATHARKGKFQLADGGTLLLDEVAELSPSAQVRLLRVLQERTVEPVGAAEPVPINVRVLSATHRDLEQMVASQEFRQDLYYRLMIYPIEVPALRGHPNDIRALFEHFVAHHASAMGCTPPEILDDVWPALRQHPWPGNVRELANVAHRSVVAHRGATLSAATLGLRNAAGPAAVAPSEPPAPAPPPAPVEGTTMADAERRALVEALDACSGNLTAAARRLGIGRATLYRKLTRHGLTRDT